MVALVLAGWMRGPLDGRCALCLGYLFISLAFFLCLRSLALYFVSDHCFLFPSSLSFSGLVYAIVLYTRTPSHFRSLHLPCNGSHDRRLSWLPCSFVLYTYLYLVPHTVLILASIPKTCYLSLTYWPTYLHDHYLRSFTTAPTHLLEMRYTLLRSVRPSPKGTEVVCSWQDGTTR